MQINSNCTPADDIEVTPSMIRRFGSPPRKPLPNVPFISRERAFSDTDMDSIIGRSGSPPRRPLPLPPKPDIEEARRAFQRMTIRHKTSPSSLVSKQGSVRVTEKEKQVVKDLTILPTFEEFAKTDFVKVSLEKILLMRRPQRELLKDKLQAIVASTAGVPTGALQALKRIREYEANIKEIRLIRIITEHKQDILDGLYLANDCLVKTNQLFSRIADAVLRMASESASNTKLSTLLMFCTDWVTHNKATTLFAKAEPELKKVVIATQAHSNRVVLKHNHNLANALTFIVKDTQSTCVTVQVAPKIYSMQAILAHVKGNKQLSYFAEIVAKDLHHFSLLHYTSLTADHLISSKWEGERHPLMTQYTAYINGLTDFILETVLAEPEVAKRMLILRFFLEVAELTFKNGDLTTTFALSTGVGRSAITRLKKTWEPLHKLKVSETFTQLEELFSPINNYAILRNKMKASTGIIPYLGLVEKDVLPAREVEPVIGAEPSDLRFNFDKLETIRKIVMSILTCQESGKKMLGHAYLHHSDIIQVVFGQKRITDEWADGRSDIYKAIESPPVTK